MINTAPSTIIVAFFLIESNYQSALWSGVPKRRSCSVLLNHFRDIKDPYVTEMIMLLECGQYDTQQLILTLGTAGISCVIQSSY